MTRPNGAVLWTGRSAFDGRPIVAIVTGLAHRSQNPKTGDMVQTWILPRWRAPHTAVVMGSDTSVCGECPLRSGQGCYVRTCDAPLAVWRAYHRGLYAPLASPSALAGRVLRVGSYGDPAALSFELWEELSQASSGRTGYTHAWRTCDQRFAGLVMASCDTPRDRAEARALGWRTFRSRFAAEPLLEGEIACPASAESGHRTTCEACQLCDGRRGVGDSRASIAIIAHGPTVRYTNTRARLSVLQNQM